MSRYAIGDDGAIRIEGMWWARVNGRLYGAYELRGYALAAMEVEQRREHNRRIGALASKDRLAEAIAIAEQGYANG